MCTSNFLRLSLTVLGYYSITSFVAAQDTLILYTETTGFNHQTADESLAMFQQIGLEHDFVVRHDEDGSLFNKTDLGEAQIVVFANTSGSNGLNLQQQAALEWFVDTLGRHLLGIHAASDTYRHSSANGGNQGAWDWYAETLGGSVQNGPNHTSASYIGTINEIIPHPSTENIDFPWVKEEEYYYWESGYLNEDIQVVMEVDTTGDETYDVNRPVGWFREGETGARIFYTSLGHKRSNYTGGFPFFEQLIEDAVLWMLSCTPVTTTLEASICAGESILVGESTYTEAGTYTDVLSSSAGCDSVVVLALDVIMVDTTVTQDGPIFTANNPSAEYQWIDCDSEDIVIEGATSQQFVATVSGSYGVILTEEGCTVTTSCIPINIISSTSTLRRDQIQVFPNPATERLHFRLTDALIAQSIELFDLSGRKISLDMSGSGTQFSLDTSSLVSGLYFLNVGTKEGALTVKVLIE